MEKFEINGRDEGSFDFLIGKKIVKVKQGHRNNRWELVQYAELICDDGTVIDIETNAGCGGCGNGWSSIADLSVLEDADNVITNVVTKAYQRESYWEDDRFTLFVLYHDKKLAVEGDDGYGNGYYGGGFYITIKEKGD